MELYSGAKTIKTRPMDLGDYNLYRGWVIPSDEDPYALGYLVGYPDSDGKFVGELEDGCNYISWSPIAEFESAYHEGDIGNASDGYHTFNELYEFRKMYNAMLFNEWGYTGSPKVHKSTRHSDGELCFGGGWFVVVAELPTGQITNHYEMKDWNLFDVPCKCLADKWDGHTPQDTVDRMKAFLNGFPQTYEDQPDYCAMCGKEINESLPEVVIQGITGFIFCSPECEAKS